MKVWIEISEGEHKHALGFDIPGDATEGKIRQAFHDAAMAYIGHVDPPRTVVSVEGPSGTLPALRVRA